MPTFAGLTVYGISYAGWWALYAADLIGGVAMVAVTLVWSGAGLAYMFYSTARQHPKKDDENDA